MAKVDELLAMSQRMARRLEELKRNSASVVQRLEDRLAAQDEYMRAAIEIARV